MRSTASQNGWTYLAASKYSPGEFAQNCTKSGRSIKELPSRYTSLCPIVSRSGKELNPDRRGWKWRSRNVAVSANMRAWNIGVYARRLLDFSGVMNERVSMRHAYGRVLVLSVFGRDNESIRTQTDQPSAQGSSLDYPGSHRTLSQ